MLNIAICDDNIQITGQMEMMVQNIAKRNFVDADIEVFWDGKSNHENHMKESFMVRPFRFLVKPVNEKQMEICFKAAYEEICSGDFYFRYSYQRMNHKVLIRDILYFESNKRKVRIVTEDKIFELYGKLNEIEKSLKECKASFLRVHQSYLVNYKHVKGQSYDFVVMDNERKISISEDRRRMISEQYCSMEDTFYVAE